VPRFVDLVVFDEAHKPPRAFLWAGMNVLKRFNFAEKIGQHTRHYC